MIGSLFEDLSPIPNDEDKDSAVTEDLSYGVDSDDYLLTALPVVQKSSAAKLFLYGSPKLRIWYRR